MSPAHRLERWIASARRDPYGAAAGAIAASAIVAVVWIVMGPWLANLTTFGFHDWDVQTAHRELVRRSLLEHGEMPFWNPYLCGGFPAWGYVEGATIVVSPWLPIYLALPMPIALRVEVAGMALIGAAGAYAAAGRFTTSRAARLLVVALWAVNGRWALQAAAGHTWHLAYAWTPWCLLFYERARQRDGRAADLVAAGAAIAMLVYSGGIYPLPHTALLLGAYAAGLAISERSARSIGALAAAGALGVGLSAPKLLPLLDGFKKAPRIIESAESMDLGAFFTTLSSRDQGFYSRPARVSPYGWHEWGSYIGVAGVIALGAAFVLVEGRRERVLKAIGAAFVLLGFGAFHPDAPWTLLHKHVPVFRSQHVPSRFVYPAVLALALVAASGLGRFIERRRIARPWLDVVAAALVLALAVDVASVARKPMTAAMWMVPPRIPAGRMFHFEVEPPFQYRRRDWAGPMYLAMLGNTGVLNCYGTPPFDRRGARAISDPRYRGEVFVEGEGGAAAGIVGAAAQIVGATAQIVEWSPSRAVVEVTGAGDGALLVYNMNYDEGWRSDAGPVIEREGAVAVRVPAGSSRVALRYRPPGLALGLLLGAATAAIAAWLVRRERRVERGEA